MLLAPPFSITPFIRRGTGCEIAAGLVVVPLIGGTVCRGFSYRPERWAAAASRNGDADNENVSLI